MKKSKDYKRGYDDGKKAGYREGYDWADKCAREAKANPLGFEAILTKDGRLFTESREGLR